jgi:hypothetical protein
MNLEKRVEQLEQRMGTDNDFKLLIVSFVGCNPDKSGLDRQIRHEVTGYSASGRDRKWNRGPGESAEELKARMECELRAEGHKVYAVCECYEPDHAPA